jgi:nucleotide-binding universal stress UspA family protein
MTGYAGAPVVVGVDGSSRSLIAVEAAAAEAVLRHRPLRIVHAFDWPSISAATTAGMAGPVSVAYRDRARDNVAEAFRLAGQRLPENRMTTEVIRGPVVPVLLAESRHADLIVLGDSGLGGLTDLLAGSVATQTATHAACPVLIVRGGQHPDGPVVAGVDGSATSALALRFAAHEATLRDTELVALHAWRGNDGTELNATLPMTYESWSGDEEERRVLAEALVGITEQYPDLRIRPQVRRGSARRLLTESSNTAQLVVVGNRGHGGFAGLLLGSVGQHLIHRAGCPTAVVRPAPAAI